MTKAIRIRPVAVDTARSPHARLRPLALDAVHLSDGFWEPRRRINRDDTLPSQFRHLEETGRLDNFRIASGKMEGEFEGLYFNDSDVYKWLEAASWSLATHPDPEQLERMVDVAITEVEDAQEPDGYVDSYFTFGRKQERWTNLRDLHELYCAGHLIQAAVAHHRATGSERLLNVAIRFADLICDTFGPESDGKLETSDGHEEIEMSLVELYRDTGNEKYLEQARFFVDVRGKGRVSGREYHQDHAPVREQSHMVGHSVRAVYMNAGVADLYAEEGDAALVEALERLWKNMTTRRMYVSGGIGSRYDEEAFGKDFELGNERAYTESCAAIGSVMWCWRMLALDGEARYADLIEHTLYNAVLPGLSLDGQHYFYQNPLEDDGTHRRQPWFGCACCPPNITRLLASLPGYFYSASENEVWVHLYAEGGAEMNLGEGRTVRLSQHTRYPWDGDVEITVEGEGEFGVMLRVPAWCEDGAEISVNGEPVEAPSPGSYAELRREWKSGDRIRLALPMPVRLIEAHPHLAENAGRVAVMRGPILYAAEAADNPGLDLRDLALTNGSFSDEFQPDLLGGVSVLHTQAGTAPPDEGWDGRLYRTVPERTSRPESRNVDLTLIPYYVWANREPGQMRVWLKDG